ncbi:MAG: hypothetical protein IJ848_00075 [Alphaproteobacteria bacterium]|nr:hypothetical protein [Alphaproteobacteria bacterium]
MRYSLKEAIYDFIIIFALVFGILLIIYIIDGIINYIFNGQFVVFYGRHNSGHKVSIFELLIVSIISSLFSVIDKGKKRKVNNIFLFTSVEKYCKHFISKFSQIDNYPKQNDISKIYKKIGRKRLINNILVPLIIKKLNIIANMDVDFVYNNHINVIPIFQLASYTVSTKAMNNIIHQSNEINELLKKYQYMTLKVESIDGYNTLFIYLKLLSNSNDTDLN